MKIYKLTASMHINTIITYNAPSESYLTINYKNGQSVTVKDDVLKAICELLEVQFIDNKLALELYSDFVYLLKGQTLIFPDSDLITPYTCFDNSQELSVHCNTNEPTSNAELTLAGPFFTSQKQFTLKNRMLAEQAREEKEMQEALFYSIESQLLTQEAQDIEKAKSLSIQSAPTLMEVAQQLTKETVNEHFFEAGIAKSEEKTPLQAYSSFSKFSTEFQLINSHKIAGFTCEFRNDAQGIWFSLITPDGDKDSLRLSEDHKKAILSCHHLADLAQILRNADHGEDMAAIIELYEESAQEVGFGR